MHRAEDTLLAIHHVWPTLELSVCRRTGPFVFLHGALSRLRGRSWREVPNPDYHQSLWGKELLASTADSGGRRPGYVARAIAESKTYWVPDIFSKASREDGLIPTNVYDAWIEPLRDFARSQYTASIQYKQGFHGTVNVTFGSPCALWRYERSALGSLFAILVEHLFDYFWGESESYYEENMRRLLEYLRQEVRDLSPDGPRPIHLTMRMLAEELRPYRLGAVTPSEKDVETALKLIVQRVNQRAGNDRRRATLEFRNLPEYRWVRLAFEQLSLVIENLVRNADEALGPMESHPDSQARHLLVRVEGTEWHHPRSLSGIEISVADAAPPIDESRLSRVFERGYTTKQAPHMGLGLWYADQVCRKHGFPIEYRLLSNDGDLKKAFCILLPSTRSRQG
jgi:hypothetical protein